MRLAIMQPYFFPYPGHFSLIAAADEWIVFDMPQYTPRSWMNRNRVLHPAADWKWLTAPLANSSIHIRAHEARLLDPDRLRCDLPRQLTHYRRAPYYEPTIALLDRVLAGSDTSLVGLDVRGLAAVCDHIGLPFRYRICSQLDLDLPEHPGPGEWAPAICEALGAAAYVNPLGGRHLFDPARFARAGIALEFLDSHPFTYETRGFGFTPGLSILDALMWNPPGTVLDAIRSYELIRA